jgi:hypothetical protein
MIVGCSVITFGAIEDQIDSSLNSIMAVATTIS